MSESSSKYSVRRHRCLATRLEVTFNKNACLMQAFLIERTFSQPIQEAMTGALNKAAILRLGLTFVLLIGAER